MNHSDRESPTPDFTVINAMPGERVEYGRSGRADAAETDAFLSEASYDVVVSISGSGRVRQGGVEIDLRPTGNVQTRPGQPYTIIPDPGVCLDFMIFGIARDETSVEQR